MASVVWVNTKQSAVDQPTTGSINEYR